MRVHLRLVRATRLTALRKGFFRFTKTALSALPALAVDGLVRNLALVMIVEFLLIHATGFYTAFILGGGRSARQKLGILAGLTAFYLLFIAVWSLIFGEWWPILIFGWLVVGKLQWLRI